jgi:hypothetical protein
MSGEQIGSGPAGWRALVESGSADACLDIDLGADFHVELRVSKEDGPFGKGPSW